MFVTWTLPLVALGIDLTQRSPESMDFVVVGICATVVIGCDRGLDGRARFRSDPSAGPSNGVAASAPASAGASLAPTTSIPKRGSTTSARVFVRSPARPWGLVGRTVVAQLCSAAVLLIALRSVGVGGELGNIEFLRVYFIVTLLGSFIPTPGGVGVIEAGLTGALVAAGAAPAGALAAVLVYRAITYVMPIMIGAAMYFVWRSRTGARARQCVESAGEVLALPPASLAAA